MAGDPLDRAMLAVSRLAQGGSAAASAALHDARERWAGAVRPHMPDEASLNVVLLVSDGLYFNNMLGGAGPHPVLQDADMDALVALLEGLGRG